MQWVSRITTVALVTVAPILAGRWLDGRLSTSYWGLVGLVLGFVVGGWQMLLLAKSAGASGAAARRRDDADRSSISGRVAKPSRPVSAASLSDETAEIAKQIEAELEKKKQSPDREP